MISHSVLESWSYLLKMEYNGPIGDSDIVDGLSIAYFKWSKVWSVINHYRTYRKSSWMIHVGIAISMILLGPFVLSQIVCFFFISVDLKGASLLILNPLTSLQSLIKVIFFWLYLDKQCGLMNLFRKDFLPSITPEKQKKAHHIYTKFSKRSNSFCVLAVFVNSFCVFVWNVLPLVRSNLVEDFFQIKLKSKDEVNKILGGWYPLPYTESPMYEAVYVYEFFACFWCGHLISMYETLIISLVMMLGTHISVLSYFIKEVTEDTKSNKENRIDIPAHEKLDSSGISSQDQLVLYVKDHQMLMRFGDEFKNMFNFLITMQLGLGLLIMTITVFHFTFNKNDPAVTFKFLVYLTYQVTEIVLYCYSGTFLETVSSGIEHSVYSSEWFKMNKTFRRACQMVMIRAQRPVSLIAVRLYPVNSITLLSIMQFTYSTSALLTRLVEEDS